MPTWKTKHETDRPQKVLAERLSARFGRRTVLKGLGAGLLTAATTGAPSLVRAQQSGHIKIASIKVIDTLDPHFTGFLSSIQIINNIHNGLLKIVYDGKNVTFEPDLAESWDIEDEKVHVFKLREGVMFHDGTPCDAEAVKFSLLRVRKGTQVTPRVETGATGDYRDRRSADDKADILATLCLLPVALNGSTGRAGTIVSPAAVQKYGADYGRNPVGTGPFKFVSWKENDAIELEANPDYFEPGLPKLERATFVLMNEASTALAALFSGQIDGMTDCPMQLVDQVEAFRTRTFMARSRAITPLSA